MNETKHGRLIGIGGKKRAGKDVFAEAVADIDRDTWAVIGMSNPLIEAALTLDPLIELPSELGRRWRKELRARAFRTPKYVRFTRLVHAVGETAAKEVPDARVMLQKLGTDVGRDMIDRNVWVNVARRKIEQLLDDGKNIVITGVRYPNELGMVEDLGGYTFYVRRPSAESAAETDNHQSEHALHPEDFNFQIVNSGTLEDLQNQARVWVAGQ